MAIRTVVTRGYGNGTFDGTISLVVVRGYISSSESAPVTKRYVVNTGRRAGMVR